VYISAQKNSSNLNKIIINKLKLKTLMKFQLKVQIRGGQRKAFGDPGYSTHPLAILTALGFPGDFGLVVPTEIIPPTPGAVAFNVSGVTPFTGISCVAGGNIVKMKVTSVSHRVQLDSCLINDGTPVISLVDAGRTQFISSFPTPGTPINNITGWTDDAFEWFMNPTITGFLDNLGLTAKPSILNSAIATQPRSGVAPSRSYYTSELAGSGLGDVQAFAFRPLIAINPENADTQAIATAIAALPGLVELDQFATWSVVLQCEVDTTALESMGSTEDIYVVIPSWDSNVSLADISTASLGYIPVTAAPTQTVSDAKCIKLNDLVGIATVPSVTNTLSLDGGVTGGGTFLVTMAATGQIPLLQP
jgi:hypothetical protein